MFIIPVIDLSKGQVVHALRGERNKYQPVKSVLTSKPEAKAIIEAYFKLYSFKIIYIADLDAIQETGEHISLICDLAQCFPDVEFWLDAGRSIIKNTQVYSDIKNIRHILGSENNFPEEEFKNIIQANPNIILSLDFGKQGLIQNHFLLETPTYWTNDVIIMMLHRVGSNEGIDQEYLKTIKKTAHQSNLFFAGGIRNMDDISILESEDYKGVLLATALHNGNITKDDLMQFYNK